MAGPGTLRMARPPERAAGIYARPVRRRAGTRLAVRRRRWLGVESARTESQGPRYVRSEQALDMKARWRQDRSAIAGIEGNGARAGIDTGAGTSFKAATSRIRPAVRQPAGRAQGSPRRVGGHRALQRKTRSDPIGGGGGQAPGTRRGVSTDDRRCKDSQKTRNAVNRPVPQSEGPFRRRNIGQAIAAEVPRWSRRCCRNRHRTDRAFAVQKTLKGDRRGQGNPFLAASFGLQVAPERRARVVSRIPKWRTSFVRSGLVTCAGRCRGKDS